MPVCATCHQPIKAQTISSQQRAYWWAVIVAMVAEYTGDDAESTHEDLKRELWGKASLPRSHRWKSKRTGRWRSRRLSLTDLSTKQMTSLIDTARKWAAELPGCLDIPPPDPAWRNLREAR